jgi:hypothetical protein
LIFADINIIFAETFFMQNIAKCKLTQEEFIKRRNNQLFSTRENQILYNNIKARNKRLAKGATERILDCNRTILLRILGNAKEITKSKDFLLGCGYNFGYITYSKRIDNTSKQIANFCFEVGILKIDENTYKILKNE